MPNADQKHGIDPKCLSMPIVADQCRSMPDQGIRKILVKSVNILQVAAALHSQLIFTTRHGQVLPLVVFLVPLMTNADQY